MPITQSRMIDLLNAARDYQNALDSAQQILRRQLDLAVRGNINWEVALRQAETMIQPISLLNNYITSDKIIALEHAHFRRFAARNASDAKRQRRLRQQKSAAKIHREQNLGLTARGKAQAYIEQVLPHMKAPPAIGVQEMLHGAPASWEPDHGPVGPATMTRSQEAPLTYDECEAAMRALAEQLQPIGHPEDETLAGDFGAELELEPEDESPEPGQEPEL